MPGYVGIDPAHFLIIEPKICAVRMKGRPTPRTALRGISSGGRLGACGSSSMTGRHPRRIQPAEASSRCGAGFPVRKM
jgi:hypothetical protein